MPHRLVLRRSYLFLPVVMALAATAIGCGGPAEPADAASPDGGHDAAMPACTTNADCDDGLYCNGAETCAAGACVSGTTMRCDDGIACTRDLCSESLRACVSHPADDDGDGSYDASCTDATGTALGDDCDDADGNRFPGNAEVCDASHDEDCDPATLGGTDSDSDGYVDLRCCNGTGCGDDCNDAAASSHPGATEACNGIDDDCNGSIDEGVSVSGFLDADADGYGDAAHPMSACGSAARFSPYSTDCDDADIARNPGQVEFCDGVDNDCNDLVDDSPVSIPWYRDADGDGFGSHVGGTTISCTPPSGYALRDTDCNDTVAGINPGSAELCNGLDDDCNGLADYRIAAGDFEDDDGDHVVDSACGPPLGLDCDDRDALTGAGSTEVCDGRDNDCDGTVDEGATTLAFFRDADGDGYGSSTGGVAVACTPPMGYSRRGGDCDDANATRHPGGTEGCNASDDDCDGAIDEGEASSSCNDGSMPHATRVCTSGVCQTLACQSGYASCDAVDPACETNILVTTASCGACGHACVGAEMCSGGACSLTCSAPFIGCGSSCFDPRSDVTHCGGCAPCAAVPNATPTCASSACGFTCDANMGDCDTAAGNGCETDLMISPTSCGMCGHACPVEPHATSGCSVGSCRALACDSGYTDCNANLGTNGDGCETFGLCPRVLRDWVWGDANDDWPVGSGTYMDVATNAGGDIFVLASYGNDLSVNGSNFTAGRFAAVIIAINQDGSYRWARNVQTSSGDFLATRILVDPASGDILVSGTGWGGHGFIGPTDLGAQAANCTPFVARITAGAGNVVWGRTFPMLTGSQCAQANAIALTSTGQLLVAGGFQNQWTLDTGAITAVADFDGYVMRLDLSTGTELSVFTFGGSPAGEVVQAVGELPGGDVVVAGAFNIGTATIGTTSLPLVGGGQDAFYARFTSTGTPVMALGLGSVNDEVIYDLHVGPSGAYYLGGIYNYSLTVGTSTISGSSGGAMLMRVNGTTNAVDWIDGSSGGGSAPWGIRRFFVDPLEVVHADFVGSGTSAVTFGGVSIGNTTNVSPHVAYVDGATGTVTRLEALATTGSSFYGTAIAPMPGGHSVIVGHIDTSGTIEGVPFTQIGSRDHMAVETGF